MQVAEAIAPSLNSSVTTCVAVQRGNAKTMKAKTNMGLYSNINAKQERIKAGSKEKMRAPGSKGAPTDEAFKQSAKTAKLAVGGVTTKQTAKVAKVMHEFKAGELHSGKGGKVVKSPKQAIAISLSEAKVAKKK